jgi:hypothetical protein
LGFSSHYFTNDAYSVGFRQPSFSPIEVGRHWGIL